MNRYDVYVFPNGRVAMIDPDVVDEAIHAGKEVLIVCNVWSGGYARAIGANVTYDTEFGDKGYEMYAYDIKDQEFTIEELSRFYKVIFTPGEMIYMETGDQANSYRGGKFIDWDTKESIVNDRYAYKNNLLTADEIQEKRETVNECATVRHIYGDREGKIQAMINRGILSENAKKYI